MKLVSVLKVEKVSRFTPTVVVGADTTAISLWERGKHSIGIVKLADVAQALDVSVSYLTMDI